MSEAAQWLGDQLQAMDAALAALVEHNSFSGNREGGQRVVRLLLLLLSLVVGVGGTV